MDKTLEFKKHTQQDKISIIVPCFNEEKALPKFYRAVSEAVAEIDGAECEFIFVDDGSSDRTPEILQEFSSDTCHSQEISARKPPCTPDWKMLPGTSVYSWMRISSTRRLF